jgi:hypothetical protein
MHTRFFGLEQRLFGVLIASYSVFVGLLVAGYEVTSSRNLAWYASRPYVRMYDLGDVTSDNLADAVAKTNAAIFVYTSRHSTFSHPQLKYLLSPEDERVPETFRVIYKQDDGWPVIAYAIER